MSKVEGGFRTTPRNPHPTTAISRGPRWKGGPAPPCNLIDHRRIPAQVGASVRRDGGLELFPQPGDAARRRDQLPDGDSDPGAVLAGPHPAREALLAQQL